MKFFAPLGDKVHRVTQTYHSTFPSQLQVDISEVAEAPVYAPVDGTIIRTTPEKGSYLVLDIGLDFQILLIHTYKWLPVGTKVKRGQVIARVAPSDKNGGYPTHVDFCVLMKDGSKPQFGLMELVDRSTTFGVGFPKGSSQYNEILNAWFYSDLRIKWDLFIDIDPFYVPTKGDRFEFVRDTNVRTGPSVSRKINGLAKTGSVGEIKQTGKWYADGYEWVFSNLGSIEGYSVLKNMRRTEKPKTFPDGSPIVPPVLPPDCEEEKAELSAEASRLRKQLADKVVENEKLQREIEELKKVATDTTEQLGIVKRFIAWVKGVWNE